MLSKVYSLGLFFFRGNFPDRLGTPYESGKPCASCKNHCTKRLGSSNKRFHHRRSKPSKNDKNKYRLDSSASDKF